MIACKTAIRSICCMAMAIISFRGFSQNAPTVPTEDAVKKNLFSKYATEDAATKKLALSANCTCCWPGPGYHCTAHGKMTCCECQNTFSTDVGNTMAANRKKLDDYNVQQAKQQKARQSKENLDAAIKGYNEQYNNAVAALYKVKDAAKHDQLLQQLKANRSLFEQYSSQAANQLKQGNDDALSNTLERMKQQQDDLQGIYSKEATDVSNNVSKSNTPIKTPAPQTAMVNTNSSNTVAAPQQGQTLLGNMSTALTQFAHDYGSAIDAKYANAKAQSDNATAILTMIYDSASSYRTKAYNASGDKALQYKIESLRLASIYDYNNQKVNNTRYDFNRKDITTGDYISFKLSNSSSYDFRFLALDKFEMPDVLFIPVCRLSDSRITRDPSYVKALGFINNCKRCGDISFSRGQVQWQSERIKCSSSAIANEDSAMHYMQQALYNRKIETNVDLLDYITIRAWYNNIKLKNAKTLADITELLQTNVKFVNTTSSKTGQLGTYEITYAKYANEVANYYLLCAYQVYCNSTNQRNQDFSRIAFSAIREY